MTPWTVVYQAPPSMGFSKQECWSGLPFPSPGDLPDLGIKPGFPALQADYHLSHQGRLFFVYTPVNKGLKIKMVGYFSCIILARINIG